MKIKANDNVLVIAGKYKGKTGKVLRTYVNRNKVVVEKVNIRTRHVRKTSTRAGERIKTEAPLDVSNLMVICPNCKKAVRVAYSIPENKKKYRVCKKCNESLEQAITKADKKKK
ncbi:50S ribosomal protein L24 [Candidatus Peregrinibacteria bacterium]|nr:50S ribosomal protein L24 [Candidatus Peregrinibacteria bacterium]